jgi:hypothetical protein
MTESKERRVPWLLWPLYALWRLVGLVFEATGRVLCALLGLMLLGLGAVLSLTLIGVPVGVPLAVLGFLLILRAIF